MKLFVVLFQIINIKSNVERYFWILIKFQLSLKISGETIGFQKGKRGNAKFGRLQIGITVNQVRFIALKYHVSVIRSAKLW